MQNFSRRSFCQTAGTAAFTILQSKNASANNQIQHAVIGLGSQGKNHCHTFAQTEGVKIAALCDVDPKRRGAAKKSLESHGSIKAYEDYRRILDDESIDTVSIATPDHWHAKIAIEAIIAGKHVYVEKPCCHNLHEGMLLVRAAEKYNKCAQQGTQYRSGDDMEEAIQFIQSGGLGKIRLAKAINHQLRGPIGRKKPESPPEGVNYNQWLGPAPVRPFTQNRWHYNWHWHWDYGTGDIGNDGIHQIDVARWGLGVEWPSTASAPGGQLFYDDDHETPDTQLATFEYDDRLLVYEMRLWTNYKLEGHDNGVIFYGDEGRLEIGRKGCIVIRIGEEPKKIGGGSNLQRHIRNFIECAQRGDPSKLNAPVKKGFISAGLCHIGNIATRTGHKLFVDKDNLTFTEDPKANHLRTRDYRKGFELPDI